MTGSINAQECNQLSHPFFEDLSYTNSWIYSDGVNAAPSGFTLVSEDVFQGNASGKLTVMDAGAFLSNNPAAVSLVSGEVYTLSGWMRADLDSVRLNMAVRRISNGNLMADTIIHIRTNWNYFALTFTANANWQVDAATVFTAITPPTGNYSIFFDQLQFCQEDGLDACNMLDYSGFESLNYQDAWVHYDGGVAGSSSLLLTADEVYEGRFSGRLAINYTAGNGAYMSSNRRLVSLDSLKYYTLNCRIKSSVDSAKLRVLVPRRSPYAVALDTYLELTNEWANYSLTFQVPGGDWSESYVRFIAKNYWIQGAYDIFFDEIKLCQSSTPPTPGPGGVNQELALWLKGDKLPNGYNVSAWTDMSSSERNATAINNGPNHISDWINQNAIARFSNSNDQLKGGLLGLHNLSQNHSWYMMIKSNESNAGRCPIAFSANGYRLEVGSTQNWLIEGTAPFTLDLGGNVEKWNMISLHASANSTNAFINTQQSLASGPLSNLQGNDIYVLGARDTNRLSWWKGEIAELIVFNQVHNSANRFKIETYFSIKYGLAIPISHHTFYDFTTHPNNLAGIGRDEAVQDLHQVYGKSMGPEAILVISNPSRLQDGDLMCWGHDGKSLASSNQVPADVENRLGRSWRIKEAGDVGKVTVSFDLTGLGLDLTEPGRRVLLIDKDGDFADANIITSPAINGEMLSFSGVELDDGDFLTLGLGKSNITSISPGGITDGLALWLRADKGIINQCGFSLERSKPIS